MDIRRLTALLPFLLAVQGWADIQEVPPASRVTIRHIEPKGIGYTQGYTTLEVFLAPRYPWNEIWTPFFDLRGHLFNNGSNKAANAGAGLRYWTPNLDRIWGVNVYYDYHRTKYQHYNQIAFGFETIGHIWDARLNAYFPVGNKKSGFFGTKFKAFSGHSMVLSSEYEFAMKGVNAEVGLHVDHFEHAPFYFAAGPYYLNGRGRAAFGGQLRAAVDIYDILRLEGNGSYDHIFKWIGQGQIGITFSLGRKDRQKKTTPASYCCLEKTRMAKRASQRVDRFEIIPIKDPAKQTPAINPSTGQPYIFWFVDNTSTGNQGVSQAPFNTLHAAQIASSPYEVIYVYPGDGTSNGMNSGITLQDGQYFLGAATPQSMPTTVGTVTIPKMASDMPQIRNVLLNIVTVGDNNTISGFYFSQVGPRRYIINQNVINKLTVTNNTFSSVGGTGIYNTGAIQELNSQNNIFDNIVGEGINNFSAITTLNSVGDVFNFLDNSYGISNFGTIENINVTNNAFANATNNAHCIYNASTIVVLSCTNSGFNNLDNSQAIENNSSPITTIVFSGNTLSNLTNGSSGIHISGGTINNIRSSGNTYSNLTNSFGIATFSAQINSLCVSKETFTNLSGSSRGILVDSITPITNANISQCAFNQLSSTSQSINYTLGTTNNTSLEILNNLFSGGSSEGFGSYVEVQNGSLCLEFIGNSASPINAPIPYQFVQSNPGVFNRTSGSDSSTNSGAFDTSAGTVGNPGTCNNPENACSLP